METGNVLERVAASISRWGMFRRGERVGVACSGGADSVCLLDVLVQLAPRWELRLSVLHFDHGLRGEESRADARFVAQLAERYGLPLHAGSSDVGALARRQRDNLEQAARRARRAFFLDLIAREVVDRIALGHTRSDQAETVLFRLLRGAGPRGLAAMHPVTPEGFVRPLIEVGRDDIERYLAERGLQWRLDHSNLDTRLARNRIRHELLPYLRRQWNPAIEKLLAQTALLLQEEERYWEGEATRLAERLFDRRQDAWIAPVRALLALPRAARRRVLRLAVTRLRGDLRGWEFKHVEAVLALVESATGSGRLVLPGLVVERSFDWVRLTPCTADSEKGEYVIPVRAPGVYRVPGSSLVVTLEPASVGEVEAPGGELLDWDRVPQPLVLRNWRPGDQYRPAGQSREIKLKELFQRARIPLWERRKWPIMSSGREIVWAARFGAAAACVAEPGSRTIVRAKAESAE
ncbi:MAG: tRNA lysidine(34) synthetase TilS [Bryobacterales bacterium]|nr:tRNA lysidine(34) synthetase TilS [Bryobacteraceae bacterium]MDW8130297.1 tRNA lysidine(34) synthetase TilS [Bryobacterales bacterium]